MRKLFVAHDDMDKKMLLLFNLIWNSLRGLICDEFCNKFTTLNPHKQRTIPSTRKIFIWHGKTVYYVLRVHFIHAQESIRVLHIAWILSVSCEELDTKVLQVFFTEHAFVKRAFSSGLLMWCGITTMTAVTTDNNFASKQSNTIL